MRQRPVRPPLVPPVRPPRPCPPPPPPRLHDPAASGRRLGRGLNALLGGSREQAAAPPAAPPQDDAGGAISVELIERNPFQPRQDFAEAELKELAESITRHGVLQPLLVREVDGEYQLIAGERRLLAAKRAGLETVPCRVLELDDQRVCEAAIEENLKRTDLHPLEKARAFRDYLDRFGGTVEALAKSLSMSRPAVSNMLRLLDLETPVAEALRSNVITAGHARALLALSGPDQVAALSQVIDRGLSVKASEKFCRDLAFERDRKNSEAEAAAGAHDPTAKTADAHVDDTGPAVAGVISPDPSPGDEQPAADAGETDGEPTAEAPADAEAETDEAGLTVFAPEADEDVPSADGTETKADPKALTPHLENVRDGLKDHLGCGVEIALRGKETGQIKLAFNSNAEFERLLKRLRAA